MLGSLQAWPTTQAALDIGGLCRPCPGEPFFVGRSSVRIGERRFGDGLVVLHFGDMHESRS